MKATIDQALRAYEILLTAKGAEHISHFDGTKKGFGSTSLDSGRMTWTVSTPAFKLRYDLFVYAGKKHVAYGEASHYVSSTCQTTLTDNNGAVSTRERKRNGGGQLYAENTRTNIHTAIFAEVMAWIPLNEKDFNKIVSEQSQWELE